MNLKQIMPIDNNMIPRTSCSCCVNRDQQVIEAIKEIEKQQPVYEREMSVQELINQLQTIDDKTIPVLIDHDYLDSICPSVFKVKKVAIYKVFATSNPHSDDWKYLHSSHKFSEQGDKISTSVRLNESGATKKTVCKALVITNFKEED